MSAHFVYASGPLGSTIRYVDETVERLPAPLTKRPRALSRRNGAGWFVNKQPRHERPNVVAPASVASHEARLAETACIAVSVLSARAFRDNPGGQP